MPLSDPRTFALALRHLPSVGRVTQHRLLALAPTFDALRAIPREQVLLRLKGTPSAADLVRTLHDDAALDVAVAKAQAEAQALDARAVHVLAPNLPGWPARLDRLERRDRPALLFVYGAPSVLTRLGVAFVGAPGLHPDAFEHAQALVPALAARGRAPVLALASAFDVVMAKVAAGVPVPAGVVFGNGLGRVAPPMRPHALAVTRSGGAMIAPFEMEHGPFAHDDSERARVQVALAGAVLAFSAAPGSPEARAVRDAQALGVPVFAPPGLIVPEAHAFTFDVDADADRIAEACAP